MKEKRSILVTGATGNQGGAVARELLKHGYEVMAMTRKPQGEKARELEGLGAHLMEADLNDGLSVERALKNIWGVFSVQNTWEAGVEQEEMQGKRLTEIAKRMGVQHFVYTSVAAANENTGIPHFDNKWRIEETVRRVGFPSYTIIRPVFFMDNFLSSWFKPSIDQGKLPMGIKPETMLQMIAVADIGKYGFLAFDRYDKMNRREINLAGDAHNMVETAKILSKSAGKQIEFVRTPIEEVRKWSEDYALMLDWFDRVGYSVDLHGLSKEFGIKPTTLDKWAAKIRWTKAPSLKTA